MIKALLALVGVLRSAWIIELAGAGLIVAGVYAGWGVAAALMVAGGMLVLKAFELEGRQ
jgi:hypothetical protein